MKVGISKELNIGEARIAATPESVKKLCALEFSVSVEQSAGVAANFSDQSYTDADAEISNDTELWISSDILLKDAHLNTIQNWMFMRVVYSK